MVFQSLRKRTRKALERSVAGLFILGQLVTPLALAVVSSSVPVQAAHPAPNYICVSDTAGANDEPGQKDLTQLCIDQDANAGTEVISWNWDELGTSGANTMDACALFDSDGDGNANHSVCITTSDSPATLSTITIYNCNDTRVDRCANPNSVIAGPYQTICEVTQQNSDPFPAGDFSPVDTVAECVIQLSDIPTNPSDLNLIDVCSYPSQQPNSDPSDCVIFRSDPVALIEVIKILDPVDDPGFFNLSVDGPKTDDTTVVNNLGHNGTTGIIGLDLSNPNSGVAVVSEIAGTNTSLDSYSSEIECVSRLNPASVIASATGTTLNVPVADGNNILCTITNARSSGSLTILKNVINDDGGTLDYSDFTFQVDGGTAENFDADVSDTEGLDGTKTLSLPTGTYSVTEPEANTRGYATTYNNCTDVQVTAGQTATCTITNDDIAPTLTLEKNVINDNNGNNVASDWILTAQADGQTALINEAGTSDSDDLTATTDTYDATAGLAYELSESGPNGYSAGSWSCDGGTLLNGQITLALNEDVTCEITNNDIAPTLTLIKDISQFDNNGPATADDFVLRLVGGDYDITDAFSNGDTPDVDANITYTLNEDDILNSQGQPGYELDRIECVITGTDTSVLIGENQVSLDEGQDVTCTFFNDDIAPKLTVTKIVTSDNGGTLQVSNFPLYINGELVVSGDQNDYDAGIVVVSEDGQDGYQFTGFSGDCDQNGSLTLQVGGVYTCTLTNDDIPAKITVTKNIINDDGGKATLESFDLFVSNTEVQSGITNTFDGNLDVTISESANAGGYTQTGIVCDDITDPLNIVENIGFSFTTELGHEYDCTITNDDLAPELSLYKIVNDDFSSGYDSSDWTLSATPETNTIGAVDISGNGENGVEDKPAKANVEYTLSEDGPDGFTPGDWYCTGEGYSLDGDKLTLDLDADVNCYITNNAIAPQLIVIKDVINNDGGTLTAGDFEITVTADDASPDVFDGDETGTAVTLDVGSYSVSENETFATNAGYAFSYSQDCTGSIALGETKYCTITNDDIAPTLRLIKHAITYTPEIGDMFDVKVEQGDKEWTQTLGINPVLGDTAPSYYSDEFVIDGDDGLKAGEVEVSENVPQGWKLLDISCYPTGQPPFSVFGQSYGDDEYELKLELADDITCEFTNIELVDITVTKYWDVDQDGERDENEALLPDWTFNLNKCPYLNGTTELAQQILPGACGQYEITSHTSSTVSQVTDETGSTTFENISPTSYYELSEDVKDGWNLSSINCTYSDGYNDYGFSYGLYSYLIFPAPGVNIECEAGNYRDTVLEIDKTNDSTGTDLLPGDDVTYTITVTNPEASGISFDTIVYDILPQGQTYVSGSAVATSSVRGNLSAFDEGVDYVVDGPATWELGDMVPGEVVVISYATTINVDTEPGVYENVAFVAGQQCTTDYLREIEYDISILEYDEKLCEIGRQSTVYGNVIDGEGDPFVESAVSVIAPEEPQGFVLGVLQVTGSPAILTTVTGLAVIMVAGGLSLIQNRRFRRWLSSLAGGVKQLVALVVMVAVLGTQPTMAATGPLWQLTVTDLPDTTTSNTLNIGFSVASIDAGDDFNIELLQNGVSIDSTAITTDFGGSGNFKVAGLPDGIYTFTVEAENSDDATPKTNEQTITVDTTAPSAPVYNGAERSGNNYTVRFAAGNDATTIRIYSSTETEFTADASTLVGTVAADETEFVYDAPDNTRRYFAVVAVDEAGNRSAIVGDQETVVVDDGQAGSNGNGTDDGTANGGANDDNGVVDDGAATDDQTADDGAGEAEGATDDTTDNNNTNMLLTIGVLVAATAAFYYYFAGRREE